MCILYMVLSITRLWMTVIGLSTAPLGLSLMGTGLLNCVIPALNVLVVKVVLTRFLCRHMNIILCD